MPLFSKQSMFCNCCGKEFETNFQSYQGIVCSRECSGEREWRKTLSIMGKAYYEDPFKGAVTD